MRNLQHLRWNSVCPACLPTKGVQRTQSFLKRRAQTEENEAQTEENEGLITKGFSQHSLCADKKRQQTLFMIAFIGSLDDLTLFVPMLVGRGFDWLQLISGAAIAGSTIVMLCLFVGLCKPVADFLGSIP